MASWEANLPVNTAPLLRLLSGDVLLALPGQAAYPAGTDPALNPFRASGPYLGGLGGSAGLDSGFGPSPGPGTEWSLGGGPGLPGVGMALSSLGSSLLGSLGSGWGSGWGGSGPEHALATSQGIGPGNGLGLGLGGGWGGSGPGNALAHGRGKSLGVLGDQAREEALGDGLAQEGALGDGLARDGSLGSAALLALALEAGSGAAVSDGLHRLHASDLLEREGSLGTAALLALGLPAAPEPCCDLAMEAERCVDPDGAPRERAAAAGDGARSGDASMEQALAGGGVSTSSNLMGFLSISSGLVGLVSSGSGLASLAWWADGVAGVHSEALLARDRLYAGGAPAATRTDRFLDPPTAGQVRIFSQLSMLREWSCLAGSISVTLGSARPCLGTRQA